MVSRSELGVVVWGALTFGAVLASYTALRPVRDALILDGNPDQIPWLFTATFIAMMIVSPLWSALVGRGRRRRVVPIAFQIFALCLVAFAVVVRAGIAPVTVGRVFYVWSAVFNLFVVSVFWSLLADLLGPSTARRLYGPIAAGGTLGTLAGPALTTWLVGTIGVAGVLAMSAVLLAFAVVAVYVLKRIAAPTEEPTDEPTGGPFTGFLYVVRSPYLRAIVGYVLCTACAATFLYLAQARIVHDALADRVARTAFFSSIDLWTAIVTLALQVAVAAPLLGWVGPGLVLCALPLVQLAGISVLAVAPSLAALAIAQVAGRSATHGLTRPARELLFTVITRDEKYRAKNAIDTVAYRFGDVSSGWLYEALTGAGAVVLIGATVPLVAVWVSCAIVLGVGFRRRAAKEPS